MCFSSALFDLKAAELTCFHVNLFLFIPSLDIYFAFVYRLAKMIFLFISFVVCLSFEMKNFC